MRKRHHVFDRIRVAQQHHQAVHAQGNAGTLRQMRDGVKESSRQGSLASGLPEFDVTTWDCFVAPAGTSPAIITRIHAETAKAMRLPDVQERLVAIGYELTATGPAALAEFLQKETDMWAEVIKKANIRAD